MGYERRLSTGASSTRASMRAAGTPGKRTLTQSLSRAVQRKASPPAAAPPDFIEGERAPSTETMDTATLLTSIDIVIEKVYGKLKNEVAAALDHLSDPEAVADESFLTSLLMSAVTIALGVFGESAFSAISESIFHSLKQVGLDEETYLAELIKDTVDKAVKVPLEKGKEVATRSETGVVNEGSAIEANGDDHDAQAEGVGESGSKTGLLIDYKLQLMNALEERAANARTSFAVVARWLSTQPADKIKPLAGAIAAPATMAALVHRHREGAMFGWMNIQSGVAKRAAASGRAEYKNGVLEVPGTIDVYFARTGAPDDSMATERFDEENSLTLYSVLVDAEQSAVNQVKRSSIPLGDLPVDRRVFIDGVPVLRVDAGAGLSVIDTPLLAAIGQDGPADAHEIARSEAAPEVDTDRATAEAQRGRTAAIRGANSIAALRGAKRLVARMMAYTPVGLGGKVKRAR